MLVFNRQHYFLNSKGDFLSLKSISCNHHQTKFTNSSLTIRHFQHTKYILKLRFLIYFKTFYQSHTYPIDKISSTWRSCSRLFGQQLVTVFTINLFLHFKIIKILNQICTWVFITVISLKNNQL